MPRDESNINRELGSFELRLAGLAPAVVEAGRDRLMFEAGRQAARRSTQVWRGLAAVLAAGLGLSIIFQPAGRPGQVVEREYPAASPAGRWDAREWAAAPPPGESAYLHVRRRVLEEGLSALPAMEPATPTRIADESGSDAL
jgi:hypothetical protein